MRHEDDTPQVVQDTNVRQLNTDDLASTAAEVPAEPTEAPRGARSLLELLPGLVAAGLQQPAPDQLPELD